MPSATMIEVHHKASSFLCLPAELRNHIYTYVLGGETFDIHCWRCYTPFGFATRILRKRRFFLALLAVCRQLHSETRLLPFRLNAFSFKSQDAFHSWLDKFTLDQQETVQNIHLVTWMARHMVEGEGWRSKPLDEVLPVVRLPGLSRIEVEVRGNGRLRDCAKDGCMACEKHGDVVELEEERLEGWLSRCIEGVEVTFERVAA
jgi:hypothetical protein